MQAICPKCGGRADVSLIPKGFSYSPDGAAIVQCPVVRERMEKNGGKTNDTDCDHMARAAQAVAHRMREGR
jgi:hypothetical protein